MQKLSIIIPNSGTTSKLRRCIESVINQTYENIEVILIDGNKDEKFETISKNDFTWACYFKKRTKGEFEKKQN